jgi:hypothetical protein
MTFPGRLCIGRGAFFIAFGRWKMFDIGNAGSDKGNVTGWRQIGKISL